MQLKNALRIGTALGLLFTFVAGSNLARAEFKDLLRCIPGEANALLVVDVEKVLKSPMAIREGWPQAQTEAYADKPLVVPPGTTRVVLAALPGRLPPGPLTAGNRPARVRVQREAADHLGTMNRHDEIVGGHIFAEVAGDVMRDDLDPAVLRRAG